jgi:aspartyl aminopeptidase
MTIKSAGSVDFNQGLLQFLQQSPTPFHAVGNLSSMLEQSGFTKLDEGDSWKLEKKSAYYVVRNDSAIIAFRTGGSSLVDSGIRLCGAHTDSPCLKVKPAPAVNKLGYLQLGVEVYGGALLHPWFDRDLSIAGRVDYLADDGSLQSCLLDLTEPVAFIPSLAIHLDREANSGRKINKQKELPPILMQLEEGKEFDFDGFLLDQIINDASASPNPKKVLSHELFFYDTQSPSLTGLNKQFIASARLDNLLSCYISCSALIEAGDDHASLLVCNDHEEVGSVSTSGAQGPFLKSVLERMTAAEQQSSDDFERGIRQSVMLSIDNAHGVHPNFSDKHDDQHKPQLNAGPVIKINANQRYASNSRTVALFKSICEKHGIPHQSFVMRSDMVCGSTIGPITSAGIGVDTVDIGLATFGMHSIRELAGAEDGVLLQQLLTAFYNR